MASTQPEPLKRRSAGILLHPTSLPGRYGIGDLGPVAHAWVETLARHQQTWWQILPLGPTGYGDSPYQSYSAFAGSPNLISPDLLARDGLIAPSDLANVHFPPGKVDFDNVTKFKHWLLDRAWQAFGRGAGGQLRGPFEQFKREEAHWLDDYALFMAIKHAHGGRSWDEWPAELVRREPAALDRARRELVDAVGTQQFRQFLFFRQWRGLREHAHRLGVKLFGDAPIFVAADSADVWAHPEQFLLDADRRPKVVAGVPPDYFSATGQLWGNPLYDWGRMKAEGYAWWIARIRANLRQVDLVRLDHFRGFEAAWHIPAGAPTAQKGEWVKGPAGDLLAALRQALGGLPLVAEDLGLISKEVHALRDQFGLPGMYILQFAYGGAVEFRFLPHNHVRNAAVYTGTHDNDTTFGWWQHITEGERQFFRRYDPHADEDPVWQLIRTAWASVADFAIVPMQDVLTLGSEARMNVPGTPSGNWTWRMTDEQMATPAWARLADLTELYYRQPGPDKRE
ncbi:MAG TPA: 4-alpha-glucanotransferase [Gemmataceae bacterium]|jgi:4-alpha-glucanotransferase